MTTTATPVVKPTGRQMYRIAYSMLEIAGLPAPETKADASALIDRLTAQRAAAVAKESPDVPF